MKKKVMAVTLAAVMAFGLTACGGSDSSSTTAAATEATTEADTEAATEAETEKEGIADEVAEVIFAGANELLDEEAERAGLDIDDPDADSAYVIDKGTLIVGITDFEPMDYQDENGNWIGFDADLASDFADWLNVDVSFVEIDWDNKILELNGKTIDCVWNGMTLTDEVTSSMACSNAYMNNAQVVVVKADVADQYQDEDSISGLSFAVEAGSAGQEVIEDLGYDFTPVNTQSSAIMEVEAGTSDAAVIDALMAEAMIGEGTSYSDLTYTVSLNSEEYGVGFRQGSDLAKAINYYFSKSYADGTMQKFATKYGVSAALVEQPAPDDN